MAQYMFSTAQRVFIYDSYVLTQSARQVQKRFEEKFPGVKVPGRTTIHNLYKKFQETGSVLSKKPNRQPRVLTEETLDDISHLLENSPNKSLRHLSQETGLSYGSVQKATKLLKIPQGDRNAERRKIWLDRIGRKEPFPHGTARLCKLHFAPDQFENDRKDGVKKLKPNAVPSVFDFQPINNERTSPKNRAVIEESDFSGLHLNESETDSEYRLENIKIEYDVDEENILQEENVEKLQVEPDFPIVETDVYLPEVKIEPEDTVNSPDEPVDVGWEPVPTVTEIKTESEDSELECPNEITEDGNISSKESSSDIKQENYESGGYVKNVIMEKKSEIHKPRPFKCDLCSKSFMKNSHLNDHYRIHTGSRPFVCEVCKKSFTTVGSLNAHVRTHTGMRPYECDICNKTFTHKSAHTVHYRRHTGVKPYSCDICRKSFTTSTTLNTHYYTHTDSRPFNCEDCGKSFSTSSHLKIHSRIHTGFRPFECDVCKKTFVQSSALREHYRTHTGERPYQCETCSKTFAKSGELSVHYLVYTECRPFKCDMCGEAFSNRNALIAHFRMHTD